MIYLLNEQNLKIATFVNKRIDGRSESKFKQLRFKIIFINNNRIAGFSVSYFEFYETPGGMNVEDSITDYSQ